MITQSSTPQNAKRSQLQLSAIAPLLLKLPQAHHPKKLMRSLSPANYGCTRKLTTNKSITHLSPPGKELISGESLPYLGRSYRLELSDSIKEIQFISNRFLVPKAQANHRGDIFKNWYIKKAEEKILPRVQFHAKRMGPEFNLAKITDSKYHWGSCTPKNNLKF